MATLPPLYVSLPTTVNKQDTTASQNNADTSSILGIIKDLDINLLLVGVCVDALILLFK